MGMEEEMQPEEMAAAGDGMDDESVDEVR